MKLIKLKINCNFRSLKKGFEINFLKSEKDFWEFNPYILIGPNGSGKSNVLEAIASIFYHIECIHLNYRPEAFKYDEEENNEGFQGEISDPNEYELEYFIHSSDKNNEIEHIRIEKKNNTKPVITLVNSNLEVTTAIEVKSLLPKYILGYSSGENEILSLPFYKMRFIHFDEYKEFLLKDILYNQFPEGRLIYLDDHFSQAILLSNFLLNSEEDLKVFSNALKLKNIEEFRLVIKKIFLEDITFKNSLDKRLENKQKIDLTKNLNNSIEKLKKCATISQIIYDDNGIEEYLILDYKVTSETKKAFKFHFKNALNLFQTFQILYTLNYYKINDSIKQRIYTSKNIYLKQDLTSITLNDDSAFRIKDFQLGIDNVGEIIYTKSLSDGEHQFIHSIGLALLFKDEECLLLLDEPETHFNPNWRGKFISTLRECFGKNTNIKKSQECLITTHSPYIISDTYPDKVIKMNKNIDNNNIYITFPEFNTFGSSISKVNSLLLNQKSTIGDYAESKLQRFYDRYEKGEPFNEILNEINHSIGDSVEKIMLINSLADIEEEKNAD